MLQLAKGTIIAAPHSSQPIEDMRCGDDLLSLRMWPVDGHVVTDKFDQLIYGGYNEFYRVQTSGVELFCDKHTDFLVYDEVTKVFAWSRTADLQDGNRVLCHGGSISELNGGIDASSVIWLPRGSVFQCRDGSQEPMDAADGTLLCLPIRVTSPADMEKPKRVQESYSLTAKLQRNIIANGFIVS